KMNPETCSKYSTDDLLSLVAGDLRGWRAQAMQRHIATCPVCSASWTEVQDLFGQARRLSDTEIDREFRERICSALAKRPAATKRRATRWRRPVLVVAAAGLAVAG